MSDANAQRERAMSFADQVKIHLGKQFRSNIDFEGDAPPSLKFLIKTSKKYEMRLEYKTTEDMFELYDGDAKTQRNETLGNFSPANITTLGDTTVSDVISTVKKYAV